MHQPLATLNLPTCATPSILRAPYKLPTPTIERMLSYCPKHKDVPEPNSCKLCASWWSLEKEQKRLGLKQERLDLDLQLLKAEKKNHRRAAQVSTQSQTTALTKLEIALKTLEAKHQLEIETLLNINKTEQEDNKMKVIEWKMKFRKQEADIMESQLKLTDFEAELQHELEMYREAQSKELGDRDEQLEQLQEQLQDAQDKQEKIKQGSMRMTTQLAHSARDLVSSQDALDALQDEVTRLKFDKEAQADQFQELEEKCKALEEGGENQDLHAHNNASTAVKGAVNGGGGGECPNCEDLEEEIYDLKLKLNKRQVEHQRQIKALKEEMENKVDDERIIETVGTATAVVVTSKTAKELQEVRKVEVDKRKIEMKFLAQEAKQESSEREKRSLEEELEEAKAATYQLALELDKLQKEIAKNSQREQLDKLQKEIAKNSQREQLAEEELRGIKEQIDRLQESQETYVTRQKDDSKEWNELIDSLSQKQRQVFDMTLPAMDTKLKETEKQIDELEKVELAAKKLQLSPSGDERQERQQSRRAVERQPPLTKVDSRKNRHVTEFDFVTLRQKGKYTGFLNAQNQPEGHGILRVDSGDVYEGEWEKGERHGQGVYTWYDGDLYTGPWFEGRRHGHGVFVFSDGRLYDGQYKLGDREGQGMFVWPYGAKYEGSYLGDKRNGPGEYVYADGRSYRGEYQDDRPHGYGVEVSKDGSVLYDGNWARGEFVGDDCGISISPSINYPAVR